MSLRGIEVGPKEKTSGKNLGPGGSSSTEARLKGGENERAKKKGSGPPFLRRSTILITIALDDIKSGGDLRGRLTRAYIRPAGRKKPIFTSPPIKQARLEAVWQGWRKGAEKFYPLRRNERKGNTVHSFPNELKPEIDQSSKWWKKIPLSRLKRKL